MEHSFIELSLQGPLKLNCFKCKQNKNCIKFECPHSFCDTCIYAIYLEKISNLRTILTNSPDLLSGNRSFIGCPLFCKESELTIPPQWLEKLFRKHGNEELATIVSICSTFLSGIITYFTYCKHCKIISSSIVGRLECTCIRD